MGYLNDRAREFLGIDRGVKEVMTFFRQGLKELRSIFYADSPHARETDPGMWGNKLPMEVYQDRHGERGHTPEIGVPEAALAKLEKQFEPAAASRDDHQRDQPNLDKE